MRSPRILLVGLLSVASLAALVGCGSSSAKSSSELPSTEHGGYYRVVAPLEQARGRSPISLDAVVAQSSPDIKLPSVGTVGQPVSAETIGSTEMSERRGVGASVLFNKGVLLTAEPRIGEAPLDLQSRLNAPGAPFSDGRKQAFEIQTIEGLEVGVQRGGYQTSQVRGEIAVNAALEWQDGDVVYSMQSDVVSVEALIAAMRSMYRK